MKKQIYLSLITISILSICTTLSGYATNSDFTNLQIAGLASPMEQFKSGIPANNVRCNDSFQLVIKVEDGSPACVKPDTANILIERGWAKEILSVSGNPIITASSITCNTAYSLGNESGMLMLYMPQNSVGKICVNIPNIDSVPPELHILDSSGNANPKITVSASQDTFAHEGSANVVYTIKTGNYSGYNGMFFSCTELPFAIGYDNVSAITMNDFHDFQWMFEKVHMCSTPTYNFNIIGLSGISFKYIQ